jgi:uncharacterized membrane protein
MLAALSKLGLSPFFAFWVLISILFGGMVNIPLKRIPREEKYIVDPIVLFGFGRLFRRMRVGRSATTLAVNLGGCVIPCVLALYQLLRIMGEGSWAVVAVSAATALNVIVCYRIARPVAGIGIAMPALIPPLVAALSALVLIPDFAPPIAFVAGVFGPLVGADLFHLRDIDSLPTGMASIGGAGTFDGIVLSGLIAAFLA